MVVSTRRRISPGYLVEYVGLDVFPVYPSTDKFLSPLGAKISPVNINGCSDCIFCSAGHNAVEHWIGYCPLVFSVVTILIGRLATPNDIFPADQHALALTACIVHAIRREVLARRALGAKKYSKPIPLRPNDPRLFVSSFKMWLIPSRWRIRAQRMIG